MESQFYFAFADGGVTYQCQSCDQPCCKNGLLHLSGGEFDRLARVHPALALVAQPRGDATELPLPACGCWFLKGGRCGLMGHQRGHQRERQADLKPGACSAYPFSHRVNFDGVAMVLVDARCPFTGTRSNRTSKHAALAKAMDYGRLPYEDWASFSVLGAERRNQLETHVRQGLARLRTSETANVLSRHRVLHAECVEGVCAPPEADILLDLLRCAGEPPRLPKAVEEALHAAIPTLRIYLQRFVPVQLVPNALDAWVLWVRSLAELGKRPFRGGDLIGLLLQHAALARVLAYASLPTPGQEAVEQSMGQTPGRAVWVELSKHQGSTLGEALLRLLKDSHHQAVPFLSTVGESLPAELF